LWLTPSVTALRILLDKNVPVGVRGFLSGHDVRAFVDLNWDQQLENGVLLKKAEACIPMRRPTLQERELFYA
jgi:hypothetical protein